MTPARATRPVLRLEIDEFRAILDPALGGVVRRFDRLGPDGEVVPVLRPAAAAASDPLDMACFPLVPFSNRIAEARFFFDGREIRLTHNFPPEPHAIHGDGWRVPWHAAVQADHAATLSYEHEPAADGRPEWPWRYRAVQDVALSSRGLTVRLALTNLDGTPMPAGLGLHPYFPKLPAARLTARLGGIWINGPDKLPAERRPADASLGSNLIDHALDNCFDGWDGTARIGLHGPGGGPPEVAPPRLQVAIDADPVFGHLVIFVPPGEDYFCVEPVSHLNDAVNRTGPDGPATGLRVLAPGETLSGTIRLRA